MNQDVMVVVEHFHGRIRSVSLELIGKAREVVANLDAEVGAILLGDQVEKLAEELISYGADYVICAQSSLLKDYTTDGYTTVIADIVQEYRPNALFIGATNNGRDLAPRLSARLQLGVTADCTQVSAEDKSGLLIWTRPALGGNILAEIICPEHRPQMGTVRPNVFPRPQFDAKRQGRIIPHTVTLKESDIRTKIVRFDRVQQDEINLEEAEIIIGGGRGMGSAEGFAKLHTLAHLLGGTVAASRAAVDAGWAPSIHQVGQTGKNVGPKIYFAFGISGAIQHMAGVSGADIVVAINRDPQAPIFQVADYGLVGDVHEILVAMIKDLEAKGRAT